MSIDTVQERYERELGNDLGNLLSRTTTMIEQFLDGRLEPARGNNDELRGMIDTLQVEVAADLDRFEITTAVDRIWELVRWLNGHVTERKPWEIAKEEARRRRARRGAATISPTACAWSAIALASYLPDAAASILDALGQPADISPGTVSPTAGWRPRGIGAAPPLFPRIDAPAAAAS